jgi:hypothetical protein
VGRPCARWSESRYRLSTSPLGFRSAGVVFRQGFTGSGNADLQMAEPDPQFNSLGAKGVGEVVSVGAAAAIANAVFHATGRRVRELPIRIEKLLA